MITLEQIKNAGIVGGGGAGFPTWKKLDTKVEWLLVNGAECEPLLKSDQFLMRHRSDEMIAILEELRDLVEAKHAVIVLKRTYKEEISALHTAIQKRKSAVEICEIEPVYPAGDEMCIVREATGRTVPPGGIPSMVGCVVINVSTCCAISDMKQGKPSTVRYVTVAGDVVSPQVFAAPIGTRIEELIRAAGGASCENPRIIMGGPMMGHVQSREAAERAVVTKTTGGVLILDAAHKLFRLENMSLESMIHRAKVSCIQCRQCTDRCPRWLLGHQIRPHLSMRMLAYGGLNGKEKVFRDPLLCSECGLCEKAVCPMGLSPKKVNIYLKQKLREQNIKPDPSVSGNRQNLREFRQANAHRLASGLGVSEFDFPVPDTAVQIVPETVYIPLKQHIGAPAQAVVKIGQEVQQGEVIGKIPEGSLGADVHASVCGVVVHIGEEIVIQQKESETK